MYNFNPYAQMQQQQQSFQDQYDQKLSDLAQKENNFMQGKNEYGIVRPEFQGMTGPDGKLLSDYTITNPLDMRYMDKMRQEGLREAGTDSQWRQLQQQNINRQAAGVNANMARQQEAALDQQAMRGGVSGGAAERMAANSVGQALKAQQNVYGMGLQADMADESNRLSALSNLGNAEQQLAQQNIGIQQQNINTLGMNREQQNQFAMNKYKEDMGVEAAKRTAAAAPKAKSGKK